MKCSLVTTNLDDSRYQQYSCHLCTMSTLITYQEYDWMLQSCKNCIEL